MEYTFKITENGFTVEIETKIIKIKNKQRKKDKNEFYINNSYYIKLPSPIIKYYNTKKVYIEQLNNTHYKISTKESINSTVTTIKENKNNNYKEYRLRLIKKYFKFLDDTYNNNSKVYSHTVSMNELSNQEKDRRRIAMDIHDTVVQDLAAIIFKNEFILHIMQSDIERARIEIKNNSDMLNNCISELRNIIFNLRPLPLENSNFKDSFCKVVDLLQKKTNMLIQYEYKGDECPDIDKVLLINVIRMIFELCTNSIKHSRGTNIYISIEITKKSIKFFVADNGCGFDYNNICKNTKGQGLSMIRDRLYIFNGSVKVTKNNDKGIKFYIDIPLKYKEK